MLYIAWVVIVWGSPDGLVHNLPLQFFTLGSSKMEVYETYCFDILATQAGMYTTNEASSTTESLQMFCQTSQNLWR